MNQHSKKNKSIWTVIATLICFGAILGIFARGMKIGQVTYRDLNDDVSARIDWHDGRSDTYPALVIPNLNTGDEITFYVPIPADATTFDALCFYQYHSEIEVFQGDTRIYEFGQEITKAGKMYGNEYVSVPLPADAYGKTLKIHVRQMEGSASSHFTEFRLMQMQDARLYPLIGATTQFLLFSIMLVLSMGIFGIYLIGVFVGHQNIPVYVPFLTAFSFLVSVWQLSYRRLFYLLISDHFIAGVSEYYALYLAPIPFLAYMATSRTNKTARRIYWGLCALLLFLIAKILSARFFHGTHLIVYEGTYYAILFWMILAAILTEVIAMFRKKNDQTDSLRIGILFALGLAGLQILLLALKNILVNEFWIRLLQRMDLGAAAILFYMASLYFYAGQGLLKAIQDRAMEEQTKILAYTDILTGIPNRHALEERMAALEKDEHYAFIFIDADGLKDVNDNLGHEMGDRLIRLVGTAVKEALPSENGFYGRWGGDEFLVCVRGIKEAEAFAKSLEEKIAEIGKGEAFDVSVSWGIAERKKGLTPTEVRALADQKMYEQKALHHKERAMHVVHEDTNTN